MPIIWLTHAGKRRENTPCFLGRILPYRRSERRPSLFQTEPVFANRIRHDVLASFDHVYCSANFTRWTRGTVFHVLRIRRKPNPGRKSLMEEIPCALRSPKAPNFQKDDQSGPSYSDQEKAGKMAQKRSGIFCENCYRWSPIEWRTACTVYMYTV